MDKTKEVKKEPREIKLFRDAPIWKSLLIMAVPAMILMLVFGMYTFMDNILSINLANDEYQKFGTYDGKDQVRLFMSGVSPVTTFMFAFVMLFGVGISRRYSINIGAKREKRAISTVKTNFQIAMLISVILIPILIFTAKPWMRSQFDGNPQAADLIADNGYSYVWIIILSLPLQMFNQIISSVFRAEAKNKQMLIAMILPIFINLFFDWIFMGPAGMGIEGGAWATFISYAITALLLASYMLWMKETRVRFKNIIGWSGFKWITVLGVVLVGIAPFLRNMAQSITQTVEMRQIQNVSADVYGNNMQMSVIMTAVFPIFGLFFPMMFGFIQAGSPITGYNYGAGNMKRVKQTTILIMLYSTIVAALIYVISRYALMTPLMNLLGIEDHDYTIVQMNPSPTTAPSANPTLPVLAKQFGTSAQFISTPIEAPNHAVIGYEWTLQNSVNGQGHIFHTLDKAKKMYGIMMISALFFGPALGAMSLFGSTDRILLNIFASSLRGVILLMPFLFGFAAISSHLDYDVVGNNLGTNGAFSKEFMFWWFYPALAFTASMILFVVAIFTMKRLDKKHEPLEAKLEKAHQWAAKRLSRKSKTSPSK